MQRSAVEAYLADHYGSAVQVRSVTQAFPGMSRETFVVDAQVAGEPQPLTIRTDPPGGGGAPVSLRREWAVHQALWGSGIPIAEPLWFDESCSLSDGRAAMIRRLVPGSTQIAGLFDDTAEGADLRRSVALEHAEHLAAIHSLDWQAFGLHDVLTPPADPADAFRADFEWWRDTWHELKTAPFPLITEVLFWLQDTLPTDSPRVSLTKGDNGVGKEVWRNGHIAAMSDWELAALSDGALDWGMSQGVLDLHDADETIAHYERHVGHELPRARLAWAVVFSTVKTVVRLNSTMWSYLDGRDRRPVLASMGLGTVRRIEHRLAPLVGGDVEEAAVALLDRGSRPLERVR